jgi:hypothetical protein
MEKNQLKKNNNKAKLTNNTMKGKQNQKHRKE